MSSAPAEIAVTLNGLSHIATPELSRDLSPDLIALLNHSRAHVRKRAILALYKLVEQYPEVLQASITRLQEKLSDDDQGMNDLNALPSNYHDHRAVGVVSATVNVLCELARKNPQEYLPLAPQLFHLMTTSSNNWMLIKIIKLVRLFLFI